MFIFRSQNDPDGTHVRMYLVKWGLSPHIACVYISTSQQQEERLVIVTTVTSSMEGSVLVLGIGTRRSVRREWSHRVDHHNQYSSAGVAVQSYCEDIISR